MPTTYYVADPGDISTKKKTKQSLLIVYLCSNRGDTNT